MFLTFPNTILLVFLGFTIEDDVKDDVDSTKDVVDEIHEGVCEEYSYNSLASKIQAVKESVSETKDIIESRFG